MDWSANYHNKFGNRNSQDSAISSHKGSLSFQDSQGSELSQVATQDVFSQNNDVSQIEPSKPTSLYEKWKNRQSMMKRDNIPPQGIAVGRPSSVPGSCKKMQFSGFGRWDSRLSLNSIPTNVSSSRGKVDDNDERKLMDQIVNSIKECNNEVQSSLLYLMNHMEKMVDVSNGQLEKSMTSFLERICRHEEALKKLMEQQGTATRSQNDLEANLASKDCHIATLEEQLAEAKGKKSQKHADALKTEIHRFQREFMDKLETIEKARNKKENDLFTDCLDNIHDQQKRNENLCKSLKNGMKDSEKRIVTDLSKAMRKMESNILSQEKDDQQKFKDLIEFFKRDIQEITMTDRVSKQDLDKWIRNLKTIIEQQVKEMTCSITEIITREFKQKEQQSNVCSYSFDHSALKISKQNSATRVAPFVSPFQSQGYVTTSRKGPSPYAVVAPQRQTESAQTFQPYEEKKKELQPVCSITSAGMSKRKCVYTHKKKCSKKKCAEEGPLTNKNESPPNLLSLQTEGKSNEPQNTRQQVPCLRKYALRDKVVNTKYPSDSHSVHDNSVTKKALEAYDFDERQDFPAELSMLRRRLHARYSRPHITLQSGNRSSQIGVKVPGTVLHTANVNKVESKPQISNGVESLLSSPSVSLMDMTFHRKIRTPFRGFCFKRGQRDEANFRGPNSNWQINMNSSPAKTLLSDI